jgi:hypothetical protein
MTPEGQVLPGVTTVIGSHIPATYTENSSSGVPAGSIYRLAVMAAEPKISKVIGPCQTSAYMPYVANAGTRLWPTAPQSDSRQISLAVGKAV